MQRWGGPVIKVRTGPGFAAWLSSKDAARRRMPELCACHTALFVACAPAGPTLVSPVECILPPFSLVHIDLALACFLSPFS